MSRVQLPHECSPFRQGSSPKEFLVKIRTGSIIILRIITDFLLVEVFGAVSKAFTVPIERVKFVLQTQSANP